MGYKIESATPTRQIVILDNDDAERVITSVSSPTVLEGDTGDVNLAFVVGLDPQDGNEQFHVRDQQQPAFRSSNQLRRSQPDRRYRETTRP